MKKNNSVCFRHQFHPSIGFCALCEAKRESEGDFERARKNFAPSKKRNKKRGAASDL